MKDESIKENMVSEQIKRELQRLAELNRMKPGDIIRFPVHDSVAHWSGYYDYEVQPYGNREELH